jgi:hypothetical protein
VTSCKVHLGPKVAIGAAGFTGLRNPITGRMDFDFHALAQRVADQAPSVDRASTTFRLALRTCIAHCRLS